MRTKRIFRQMTRSAPRPSLRLSPYAWAKLLYLRDRGETEIGGFGLSAENDPLAIVDILTVKQRCTPVTVAFDDTAVADLCDAMVDQGIAPDRFLRVWFHTHPANSAQPSNTDKETFERVFGRNEWAVMAIVAQGGATYARLAFHVGPGGALKIPMQVDYRQPFNAADWNAWEQEYLQRVIADRRLSAVKQQGDAHAAPVATELPWEHGHWEDDFYRGGDVRPF